MNIYTMFWINTLLMYVPLNEIKKFNFWLFLSAWIHVRSKITGKFFCHLNVWIIKILKKYQGNPGYSHLNIVLKALYQKVD